MNTAAVATAIVLLATSMWACGGGASGSTSAGSAGAAEPASRAPEPQAAESDPPWLREVASKRLVYSVPGMERIGARKDMVYKRAGVDTLTMDVWAPAGGGARPAIVFIHGGPVPAGLRTPPKEWVVFQSYGRLAAASGFVGITFNHRFHDYDRLGDAMDDVSDLVAYVRGHAGELGIDGERICLWAFSGGGSFVSIAMREGAPPVRCLVSYYGRLDVRPQRSEFPPSVSDEALRDASPVHHVAEGRRIPPMLIARAGQDAPEINSTVDEFIRQATARKAPLQVLEHPKGQHAFDTLDDDERTREIIAETMRFVGSRLDGPP